MGFRVIDGTGALNKTNSCRSRVQSLTYNARMSVKLAIFGVFRKSKTKTLDSHLYDHHGIIKFTLCGNCSLFSRGPIRKREEKQL